MHRAENLHGTGGGGGEGAVVVVVVVVVVVIVVVKWSEVYALLTWRKLLHTVKANCFYNIIHDQQNWLKGILVWL